MISNDIEARYGQETRVRKPRKHVEYTTHAKEDAYDTWYNHHQNCPLCGVDDDCTVALRLWERFVRAG